MRAQTSHLPGDLVPQLLAGDDCDFFAHPLVCVEVHCQTCVVFLNDDPCGLLDGLSTDATLKRVKLRFEKIILYADHQNNMDLHRKRGQFRLQYPTLKYNKCINNSTMSILIIYCTSISQLCSLKTIR